MSINIENEATCQLAQELAQLTGETVPDAVAAAIAEYTEREKLMQKMRAISQSCALLLRDAPDWPSAVEHGDLLYDERGLPK